jgi:formamidopyrimidine-DNA glycosylase
MPELPEVETVCRGLAANLLRARVTEIIVRRKDLRAPVPANLKSAIEGRMLLSITRRAKYILFHFDDGQVLIAHLGMSGRMSLYKEAPKKYLMHDHVILKWSDGHTLVFNDARRFGLLVLSKERELAKHPLLKSLGPEPLDGTWNGASLYNALKASSAPVKSVIMDQRKVVGVGNIYACEALFSAKIHPRKPARDVTRKKADALAQAIREVLEAAIASGGSTLRDYVRPEGLAGYFQHRFNVYGRQKHPCFVCKTPVQVIRQSGRSTFFCGHCQR